jgi:hypothetical protein
MPRAGGPSTRSCASPAISRGRFRALAGGHPPAGADFIDLDIILVDAGFLQRDVPATFHWRREEPFAA